MQAKSCIFQGKHLKPERSLKKPVGPVCLALLTILSANRAYSTQLPVKVQLPAQDERSATGWDFNGDGRPDFVQVEHLNTRPAGERLPNKAYDFDGDGKPDYFRSNTSTNAPNRAINSSATQHNQDKYTETPHEHTNEK